MANCHTRKNILPRMRTHLDYTYLNGTYKFRLTGLPAKLTDEEMQEELKLAEWKRNRKFVPSEPRLSKFTKKKLAGMENLCRVNFDCKHDKEYLQKRVTPADDNIPLKLVTQTFPYSTDSCNRFYHHWPAKVDKKYDYMCRVNKYEFHNKMKGRLLSDVFGIIPESFVRSASTTRKEKRPSPYESAPPVEVTIRPRIYFRESYGDKYEYNH